MVIIHDNELHQRIAKYFFFLSARCLSSTTKVILRLKHFFHQLAAFFFSYHRKGSIHFWRNKSASLLGETESVARTLPKDEQPSRLSMLFALLYVPQLHVFAVSRHIAGRVHM